MATETVTGLTYDSRAKCESALADALASEQEKKLRGEPYVHVSRARCEATAATKPPDPAYVVGAAACLATAVLFIPLCP